MSLFVIIVPIRFAGIGLFILPGKQQAGFVDGTAVFAQTQASVPGASSRLCNCSEWHPLFKRGYSFRGLLWECGGGKASLIVPDRGEELGSDSGPPPHPLPQRLKMHHVLYSLLPSFSHVFSPPPWPPHRALGPAPWERHHILFFPTCLSFSEELYSAMLEFWFLVSLTCIYDIVKYLPFPFLFFMSFIWNALFFAFCVNKLHRYRMVWCQASRSGY